MLVIEISASQVNLIEGVCKGSKVHVKRFASVTVKEGSVKNGVISNTAELGVVVRESLKRYGFQSKKAAVVVNSTAIVTREVIVPEVKPREMHALLYGEVEMAASRQDYILDYVVLERFQQDGAGMCRILCIVVPKMIVEACRDLTERQLGLKAEVMDVTTHAIYKLLCRDKGILNSGKAMIIASVQEDELCLVLAEGDSKVYFRTTAITTTSDVMDSEYILSAFGGNEAFSECGKRSQVITAATDNISKLIQFQAIKNKENPVQEILLTGALSGDQELAGRISETVGIPAKPIDKPSFVNSPCGMDFGLYANAIGLLLPI